MNDQDDIFIHGVPDVVIDDLVKSLLRGDVGQARQLLNRHHGREIDEHQYQLAMVLIGALELPVPVNVEQGLEFMERMDHEWQPAARGLLGMCQHQYLSSIWKNIGQALESLEFDPNHPNRHASRAYWEGHHWNRVKRCIVQVPDYTSQPALLIRLADADYRLYNRANAIASWFLLCRFAPLMFKEMIENKEIPDQKLYQSWLISQEPETEPELTSEWFPAWMLMEEPGLATVLEPCPWDDPPSCAFNAVLNLIRHADLDDEGLKHRQHLHTIHPGLFERFMAKRT